MKCKSFRLKDRIREAREAKFYTQEDLAEQLGISPQTISKWERGISRPNTYNMMRLAEILEIKFYTYSKQGILLLVILSVIVSLIFIRFRLQWIDVTDEVMINVNFYSNQLDLESVSYRCVKGNVQLKFDVDYDMMVMMTCFNVDFSERFYYFDGKEIIVNVNQELLKSPNDFAISLLNYGEDENQEIKNTSNVYINFKERWRERNVCNYMNE